MSKEKETLGAAIGCVVVLILIAGPCSLIRDGCSTNRGGGAVFVGTVDAGGTASKIGEVAVAEREIEKWAQGEKDTLLNQLLTPATERRQSALRRKREEEDRAYEKAERDEANRIAVALGDAEAMERKIKELGMASDRQEDELRTFALKESPAIWQTIQYLRAEMEVQDARIDQLKTTCQDSGTPYRNDPDFRHACRLRNKLVRSLRLVEDRLVEALVAQREYRATPLKSEFERAMRKALEDGVLDAELTRRQYEEMKNER